MIPSSLSPRLMERRKHKRSKRMRRFAVRRRLVLPVGSPFLQKKIAERVKEMGGNAKKEARIVDSDDDIGFRGFRISDYPSYLGVEAFACRNE